MKFCKIAVSLLFGLHLSTWELNASSSLLFDGKCINVTGSREGLTMTDFFGIWYTFALIPKIPEKDITCLITHNYLVDSTVFFDRYWIDPRDHHIYKAYGYFTYDGPTIYSIFVHPYEYIISSNLIGVGNEIFAAYSCNECGYYGTQDGGMHPFIFTRECDPKCTVTDPIWKLLESKNITKDVFTMIDNSACQPIIDHINGLHTLSESPSS